MHTTKKNIKKIKQMDDATSLDDSVIVSFIFLGNICCGFRKLWLLGCLTGHVGMFGSVVYTY